VIPLHLRLVATAVLLLLLAWVVRLIRRQRLTVQDSLAWLVSTLLLLAVVAFPQVLAAISRALGIQVPSNALFALGLLYLAVNTLSLTVAVSAESARVRRLVQECALLRQELEALGERPPAARAGEDAARDAAPRVRR
jgi:hypothetical protein